MNKLVSQELLTDRTVKQYFLGILFANKNSQFVKCKWKIK